MDNFIHFATKKQGQRIQGLQEETAFRARVFEEARKALEVARHALAKGIDELGVPTDGRTMVVRYENSFLGEPGIYFETFEFRWDEKKGFFVRRTREEGAAWAKHMATLGVKIEIPPDSDPLPLLMEQQPEPPPTTQPTG